MKIFRPTTRAFQLIAVLVLAAATRTGAQYPYGNPSATQPQRNAEQMREVAERTAQLQREAEAANERARAQAEEARRANAARAAAQREAFERKQEQNRENEDKALRSLDPGNANSDYDPEEHRRAVLEYEEEQRRRRNEAASGGENSDRQQTNDAADAERERATNRSRGQESRRALEKARRERGSTLASVQTDPVKLERESKTLESADTVFQKYCDDAGLNSLKLNDDPAKLYLDEYLLPKDSQWTTASQWWRDRVKSGDSANQLYLVEPGSAQQYDEDGLPVDPGTVGAPKALPQVPRYEKASEWQRRRWSWLPDSPDQLYLVE